MEIEFLWPLTLPIFAPKKPNTGGGRIQIYAGWCSASCHVQNSPRAAERRWGEDHVDIHEPEMVLPVVPSLGMALGNSENNLCLNKEA